MSQTQTDPTSDQTVKAEVLSQFEEAKTFAKSLNFETVKSGEWFIKLLQQVVRAYNHNARAKYFQQKYPGLPPDDIADTLASVAIRYATLTGAVAGAATTANQVTALTTAGMTAPLFIGAIGAEMITLAGIQMRLILDMSVIYDLQLDPEDPEDILMIFGYALGVAPAEMLGKGLQVAAGAGTKVLIQKHLSKGTLQAVQNFARNLGMKLLQRTVIKYAVPLASAAVGSSYNYMTTRSVAHIAKSHFRNRGKATDELRSLLSRQHTYELVFPAAVMYMAQVDGEISNQEKELYRAMLSRMSFEAHTPAEFQALLSDEDQLFTAIPQIEDPVMRRSLVEMLVLMAIYNGELADQERDFLEKVAHYLNVTLDLEKIVQRAQDYRIIAEETMLAKSGRVAGEAAVKVLGTASQAAGSAKAKAVNAGSMVKGAFGRVLKRQPAAATPVDNLQ